MRSSFSLLAATLAATLTLTASPAPARDDLGGPLARRLLALDVGSASEHRFVIVHPLYAATPPAKRLPEVSLGGLALPELLAFGKLEKGAKPRVELLNLSPKPAALLPGDVLRTDSADYAVLRDVVAQTGTPVDATLVRISHETAPDPKALESRMLGPVLPPTFRWLLLSEEPGDLREMSDKWAAEIGVATPRRSPAEFAGAERIAKRLADYRKALSALPKRAPPEGREIVGCAVLLDGAFASYEAFDDAKQFADAWPRLLDGIAVEAAVMESVAGLIETDLAAPADPDRHLTKLKKDLGELYAAKSTDAAAEGKSRRHRLETPDGAGDALVLSDERVFHVLYVVDPSRRGDEPMDDDPNLLERRRRLTELEKRLKDRRENGPKPAGPAGPPTPLPPPPEPK